MRGKRLTILGTALLVCMLLAAQVLAGGCDSPSQVSSDIVWISADMGDLLGAVSMAVQFALDEEPAIRIDSNNLIVVPSAKILVGHVYVDLSYGDTREMVWENLSEVLARVGDLVLTQLGDWSLGLVIEDNSYYNVQYTVGYIPAVVSENELTLEAGEIVPVDPELGEQVAKVLELLQQTMIAIDPSGEGEGEEITYIPGIGAYLEYRVFGINAEPELDECMEWVTFVHDSLSRVGDLVFGALDEDECLIISTDSLGYGKGYLCFSITADTVDSPEEWTIYLVGAF